MFLDPTQSVADRVRVANKHLSRTAHRRIIVLPHPKRLEKHLPVLVGKVAVTGIVHKYEVGETTQRIGNHYGISKTRVAIVLRKQGITMRRQGLTDDQVDEAVGLYSTGKSLAWIGTSPTQPSPLRFGSEVSSCDRGEAGGDP
jgi:hypothetical protein